MSDGDDKILHFPQRGDASDELTANCIATLEHLLEEAKAGNLTALTVIGVAETGGLFRSWFVERDASQRILLQGLLADTLTAIGALPLVDDTEGSPPDDAS